jgi:large subunit ribosomal protein L20
MPRSVNTVASRQRRKKILKKAKGYFGRRKNVYTVAKNAVEKALSYAYRDRKNRKRVFRSLWITRINAGAREYGLSYSELISKLKSNNISINRKVLADLAMNDPKKFEQIIKSLK